MGFDPVTQKEDTIQYVPTDSTLKAVLSHEDVLAQIHIEHASKNGVLKVLEMVRHLKRK